MKMSSYQQRKQAAFLFRECLETRLSLLKALFDAQNGVKIDFFVS